MKKTITIITFSVLVLVIVAVSFFAFNSFYKTKNTVQNVDQVKNTEPTVDDILKKQEEKFKKDDESFQKVVEESDFDPETASPQEVVDKLDKLDKVLE